MDLNYTSSGSFQTDSSKCPELDFLITSILIMHDPDGRELDSEMLLRVVETIMYQATASQVFVEQQEHCDMSSIVEESQGTLENSIYQISREILSECYGNENVHECTLSVFRLLGSYRWDAKMLLALSAFATVFGDYWVIIQSHNQNPLAATIAKLKQIPTSLDKFEPIFIAQTSLVKTMVEVIKSISQFEGLPITHIELPNGYEKTTKLLIYDGAYWIIRSIVVCISLITNLGSIEYEKPYSILSVVWEIASLKGKIRDIGTPLRAQVDACQQKTEQEMYRKLVNEFQEPQFDNQEVLRMLFGMRNDLPLKRSSEQVKVGISSLKNKVVILLFTKPELLPVDELFSLVQQTYNHPQHINFDRIYGILWIPISSYEKWSENELTLFHLLSNSLPWYSIRQPWLLSSTTINYAKKEWVISENPTMVVLDHTGAVSNTKANDIIWIWGVEAYPFSASREEELWKTETWNLRLLLNNIDPLLTKWVEEGRTICIYGSNSLEWVRKFSADIKDIQNLAAQLEVVYVGKDDQSVLGSYMIAAIEKEKLSFSLTLTKISLFWRRLKSIRRSKLRHNQTTDNDHILREVIALLGTCIDEKDEDWMIFGRGSSTNTVKLNGTEWANFLSRYQLWEEYLPKVGLINAIRLSLEPPSTVLCSHTQITRFNQVLMDETMICETCKRPMEKFIMYECTCDGLLE